MPERIALSEAIGLGIMQGPAELMPISSSGHMTVIPWLLGREYVSVDPELRKAFEVALHAGTAAALLITLRAEVLDAARHAGPRLAMLVGLSFLPPAIVGFGLERPIEQRLGQPGSIGVALIAGAAGMAWADRCPQERGPDEAGALDAFLLGVAQAAALVPGVSRNGATLTAARFRRFSREEANRLSRHVALPVIAAATGLKVARLSRRGLPAGAAAPFAAGAIASFVSTLGSTWVISQVERDRSLLPYAIYRGLLGGAVLRRIFNERS
jgi:undecaprenyl-diphosphatase